MHTRFKFIIFILLPVFFLISISQNLIGETWYKLYDKARESIEQGQYTAAIGYLQEVILKAPESKTGKKSYGTSFVDYYPYYYLGLCFYKQQNYSEAMKWLEKEEEYGQIQESEFYSNLQMMLNQSTASLRTTTKPVTGGPTNTTTVTSTQNLTSTTSVTEKPITKPLTQPSALEIRVAGYISKGKKYYSNRDFEKALSEFRTALSEDRGNKEATEWSQKAMDSIIQTSIAQGENLESRRDFNGALAAYKKAGQYAVGDKNLAARIKRVQDRIDQDSRAAVRQDRIKQLLRAGSDYRKSGNLVEAKKAYENVLREDSGNTEAKRQLQEIDNLLNAQASSAAAKRQIEGYLGEAAKQLREGNLAQAKDSFASAAALDNKNPELERGLAELKDKNREQIKRGFEHYLKGDLDTAEKVLKDCARVDDKQPGLFAFIGSIAYTRFIISGERDDTFKTRADSYFRETLRLDQGYTLSPKIFSPAVIAYYKSIR
jgi:tetratricopeptide (TPR) repeat protein